MPRRWNSASAQADLFLRAEDFMRHFLGALYRKDTLAFKEELRTAEVLIIDDLQHICRSTATASSSLYVTPLPICAAGWSSPRPRPHALKAWRRR